MHHSKVLIAGCGYVGTKLAQSLLASHDVSILVRTETSARKLDTQFHCLTVDLDDRQSIPEFSLTGTTLFYFIPPPSTGITDERLERFLKAIKKGQEPDKIILISTTGIYGNCADDWVDESRTPHAETDRARRRLAAEQTLAEWCNMMQCKYIILRVPGIYGPGKLPVQRIVDQKPILSLTESPWSNRIHIDDLVQTCQQAMDYSGQYKIFNVSDGNPSSMSDFFLKVAKKMGLPQPEQISLDECKTIFSDNMISYLLESKKIVNKRMLDELKVQLRYPTLDQGLAAICIDNSEKS